MPLCHEAVMVSNGMWGQINDQTKRADIPVQACYVGINAPKSYLIHVHVHVLRQTVQ